MPGKWVYIRGGLYWGGGLIFGEGLYSDGAYNHKFMVAIMDKSFGQFQQMCVEGRKLKFNLKWSKSLPLLKSLVGRYVKHK